MIQCTRREELETRYLVALMRIDAKVWRERTQFATGGVVDGPPDEPDKKQDAVRNGQHAAPLDSPTAWTGYLGTRGWSS